MKFGSIKFNTSTRHDNILFDLITQTKTMQQNLKEKKKNVTVYSSNDEHRNIFANGTDLLQNIWVINYLLITLFSH